MLVVCAPSVYRDTGSGDSDGIDGMVIVLPGTDDNTEDAESGGREVAIPYLFNRAVIFDGKLAHQSQRSLFRSSHAQRRASVTLLYGDGYNCDAGHTT